MDIGPRGEIDLGVVPLDELALAGLTRTVAAGVPGPPPADPPGLLPAKLTDAVRVEGVAA